MKHFFCIYLVLFTLASSASEHTTLSYFQTLVPELKLEIITSSGNVISTVRCMSKLRAVCKSFADASFNDAFLTSARNQFPGQEIRIARMLHTPHAASWLRKHKPDLKSFEACPNSIDSNMIILKAIQDNDMDVLTSCLNDGVNPTNYLFFLHAIKHDANVQAFKLLVSYGADLLFSMQSSKKIEFCNGDLQPASLLECVSQLVKNHKQTDTTKALAYESIYEYLKTEVSSD